MFVVGVKNIKKTGMPIPNHLMPDGLRYLTVYGAAMIGYDALLSGMFLYYTDFHLEGLFSGFHHASCFLVWKPTKFSLRLLFGSR